MRKPLGRNFLFLFISTLTVLQLTGCASTRSRPDAVRQLSGITIVVDSMVVEGRSFKNDLINVPQNIAIAEKIGKATADILNAKGYKVNDVHLYSAGAPLRKGVETFDVALSDEDTVTYPTDKLTGKEARQIMWSGPLSVDDEESSVEPENKRIIRPPFAIKPVMNDDGRRAVRKFFQNLAPDAKRSGRYSDEYALYGFIKTPLPIDARAVLAIQASGKYISNLAVAGNVAQAAMLPLLIFTGGRGAEKLDFSANTLDMKAYIIDMEKGEILWAASLNKSNSPEGANFLKFIEKVFKELPTAGAVK